MTCVVALVSQNVSMWNQSYDWSRRGDEWSDAWGGVSHQWWTTLFPRLQGYLPAARILEIAPGYGRWTHFLKDLCDELVIVDIAESAIEYCRERFENEPHISAHVNDGRSLAMVADESINLAFSFDSLVHAEVDVLRPYLDELARILTADGVAFLHHSNIGALDPETYDLHDIHWRATTVGAPLVEHLASSIDLSCISQEMVAWGNESLLNDCFSVITRAGSCWDRENVVVENLDFTRVEIAIARRLATQYPPSHSDVRFCGIKSDASADKHAQALALLESNEIEKARRILSEHLRRSIDPDAVNDLAVLTAQCGERDAAIDLLRTVTHLHPGHAAAAQNLADLSG